MARKLTRMAIAYDFDGTLAAGNMQEHSFIPDIQMSNQDFWRDVKRMAKEHDMDEILSYMFIMLQKACHAGVRITRKDFKKHGKSIEFFPGVQEWFPRLDNYARDRQVKLEHFIISSGLREMVNGSRISGRFKYVFASGFAYDQNDVANWPALAVNYTTKTQYLFRINKGILNSYDNYEINKYVPDEARAIPFCNMAYLGDGETDVPCMKMIKHQGGCAVAVYNPNKRKSKRRESPKEIALRLLKEKRADFALPADYTEDGPLDVLMKAFIDRVAASARMGQARSVKKQENGEQAINEEGEDEAAQVLREDDQQPAEKGEDA